MRLFTTTANRQLVQQVLAAKAEAQRQPPDPTCETCDGTGLVDWTSPPHRGDPRYRYACGCTLGREGVPPREETDA